MTEEATDRNRHLDGRQVQMAMNLMDQHVRKTGAKDGQENDLVEYAEGWSDKRIAEEIGAPDMHTPVGRLRVRYYGVLYSRKLATAPAPDTSGLREEITALRALATDLKDQNATLASKLATLHTSMDLLRRDLEKEINQRERITGALGAKVDSLEKRVGELEAAGRRAMPIQTSQPPLFPPPAVS